MSSSFLSTTPNQLGSGVLPSHYDEILFELSDGNWVNNITLPEDPADRCIVTIYSSATKDAVLHLPFGSLIVKSDSEYYLEYHAETRQWDIQGTGVDYLTPGRVGNTIPDSPQVVTFYSIDNCNYVSEVTLPTTADDGAVIIISSTACIDSQVSGSNILFGSTRTIKSGEQYIYRYQSGCYESGWVNDTVSNKLQDNMDDDIPDFLLTTPNQLGGGVLPSGYDEIVFELSDGNWVKDIILPENPTDRSIVTIYSSAAWDTTLHHPSSQLKIKAGSEYYLEYNAYRQQWYIKETDVNDDTSDLIPDNKSTRSVIEERETTGSSSVYAIPESTQKVTDYMMDSDNWASEIRLPSTAEDESTITIHSTAIRDSTISSENLLYASTTTIKSDDQYVFKYLKKFSRWVLESAPIRNVEFDNIQSEIPFPTSPATLVTMTDSHWRENIKLPERAADRDKITLKSSTDAVTHIDAANVNEPGVMTLRNGEQYDFFYIAEKEKWQLISSPDTLYQAQNITNGLVPALRTPRTIINATNGNDQPELRLPTGQEAGSRVIINSSAERDISVSADETHYKVLNGETVAFKVDEQGLWQRETITIDLLLLYSDKAVAHSGRDKVHDFMMEGFDMTNEALENSGANFRYRVVGLREIAAKADWIDMPGMLENLRKDPLVQRWRDTLKADGIYYVGTEDLCGRGWLNNLLSPMDPMYMVSVGSIICDPEVMRHELGHNMGADDKYGCDPDTQECELIATIMNQMWVDYYSTPDRYTADYGIPMGIPDKFDDVLTMNKMSSVVAAYR